MLRLADESKSYPVKILDTVFYIKSLSIFHRKQFLSDVLNLDESLENYVKLLDMLCTVIVKIDGYEDVRQTLMKLESMPDMAVIIRTIVNYSSLSELESKNSGSSPEQSATDSVRIVDKNALKG